MPPVARQNLSVRPCREDSIAAIGFALMALLYWLGSLVGCPFGKGRYGKKETKLLFTFLTIDGSSTIVLIMRIESGREKYFETRTTK